MRELLHRAARFRERSAQYFTVMRDTVTRDNLRTLRRSSMVFELVLVAYGLWAAGAFQNLELNKYYVLFLFLNLLLLLYVFQGGRVGLHTYPLVQAGCMLLIAEMLAFAVAVSVFPFPDRPAIFYTTAYTLALMLFRLRVWQSAVLFSAVSAVFVALCRRYKAPEVFAYDLVSAATAWLLGFLVLFIVTDLYLRGGEAQMKLDRESRTDFLTDLPNRRELEELLNRFYRRCVSLRLPIAVVMLDIDFFKRFNDTHGHPAGDRCLAEVGRSLKAYAKETGCFAARYGGEEFVILLPGCGEEEAGLHARALLERLRIPMDVGESISVSVGAAVEEPGPDDTPGELLRRADQALYRAKEDGRDRYVLDAAGNTVT